MWLTSRMSARKQAVIYRLREGEFNPHTSIPSIGDYPNVVMDIVVSERDHFFLETVRLREELRQRVADNNYLHQALRAARATGTAVRSTLRRSDTGQSRGKGKAKRTMPPQDFGPIKKPNNEPFQWLERSSDEESEPMECPEVKKERDSGDDVASSY